MQVCHPGRSPTSLEPQTSTINQRLGFFPWLSYTFCSCFADACGMVQQLLHWSNWKHFMYQSRASPATQGNGGLDVLLPISFPGKRISQAKRRKQSQHSVEDWNNGSTDTILAFGIFHNVCIISGWNAACGVSKRWSFQQDHCPFLKEDIGLLLLGTGRRKVHVTLGRAHLAKGNSLKLCL